MGECIAAVGLTKTYLEGAQEVVAVRNINLSFTTGQVIGLFGPSGSGKTTLLSLLGCILRPTAGSLRLFGREVSSLKEKDLPPIRKQLISFVFQGFNLFPALTTLDNVLLGLRVKGIVGRDAETRALRVLDEVGLSARLHFLPRDLSGGQKQRVAIARALASDSPLILADEPTGNLDYANGRKVMELLCNLALREQRCVVVASHDNRIEDLFDRKIVMEDGNVVNSTSPRHN